MKKPVLFSLYLLMCSGVPAQSRLSPLPEPGFEQRITDYVHALELSDSHEHLMPQESVKNGQMNDFMLLLHHYADDDIKSAGMSKAQFAELLTDTYSAEKKWKIVKPYWEAAKNTAYCRAVLLATDQLYGIRELNDSTVIELSELIRESYNTDWYNYVLKDKAKIKYAVMDVGSRRMKDNMFRYVEKFDQFIRIDSKEDLIPFEEQFSLQIIDLEDLVTALEIAFEAALERGIVGIKSAAAYHRILRYENVSEKEAEKTFNDILKTSTDEPLSFEEVKPLQDYMMHQIIRLAEKHRIPIQIHTGLHAGDGNYISNSNPALLVNLFLEYRDVNFILFHGSYPYGGELSALAKSFRNVYLDMSWLYVISPSYAERYLYEWLETVPANKIMAFGGDYHNVENVYAHSLMARALVSKVLIEKVRSGYMSEDEAKETANRILFNNVIQIFGIE